MKFSTKLIEHYVSQTPVIVTIGFFDGFHLGHNYLFKKLAQIRGEKGYSYVISFSNHPNTILRPDHPVPLITTTQHRIKLIEEQKVDSLIMLPFTEELKELSPDEFVSELYENLAFTDLLIGPDSTIGKDREGNFELISLLAKKYSFKLHRLDFFKSGPLTISSSLIRQKINQGNFELVSKLLGRPYSILAQVEEGEQKGQQIGFPTLNFEVEGLSLPPCGVYKVSIIQDQKKQLAIANLGFAPSLKERTSPLLEVHLLQGSPPSYGDQVEIIFDKFLREEKKFHSVDELKEQISKDIQNVIN